MAIEVEVKGTEELMRVLERRPLKMREKVDARLGEGAEAVAEKAREIVPVRTGYLRSTIAAVRTSPRQWRVQATAHYARWVEYGSSRNPSPHPFLRPALILMKPLITSLIRVGLVEAIEERQR